MFVNRKATLGNLGGLFFWLGASTIESGAYAPNADRSLDVPPTLSKSFGVNEMQSGKIKWFDDDKGYGFIVPDDGSADVFLHKRDVASCGIKNARQALKDGREVKFRSEDNPRGGGRKIARYVELA